MIFDRLDLMSEWQKSSYLCFQFFPKINISGASSSERHLTLIFDRRINYCNEKSDISAVTYRKKYLFHFWGWTLCLTIRIMLNRHGIYCQIYVL